MIEEKKRVPRWWLAVSGVLLATFAAVMGFVETVGLRGTIIGRYERVKAGMSKGEVLAILGPDRPTSWPAGDGAVSQELQFVDRAKGYLKRHFKGVDPTDGRLSDWAEWEEGPEVVYVDFVANTTTRSVPKSREDVASWTVVSKDLLPDPKKPPTASWRIRRWAEQAYTTIHGPRR